MDFETIGSITAIFVAICALVVSIWQGLETRKNYRLSVTPNISILGNWVFELGNIGIHIENKGIGPAIINDVEVHYSDKKYNYLSEYKDLNKVILEDAKQIGIPDVGFHIFDFGEYLKSGETLPIIYLAKSDSEKDF